MVIGAGPAGQMAAKKAALLGRKVGVVDPMAGRLSVQRRMRKLMLRLYGFEDAGMLDVVEHCRKVFSDDPEDAAALMDAMPTLQERIFSLFKDDDYDSEDEAQKRRKQLQMRNLTLLEGRAKFLNLDEIEVNFNDGKRRIYEPSNVVIATGSKFVRDEGIPYDDATIFDTQSIFDIDTAPESILIYGNGVVPVQFAITFALLGASVTLLTPEEQVFPDLDDEVDAWLVSRFENMHITLVTKAEKSEITHDEATGEVVMTLENDQTYGAASLLWMADRIGNTATLECEEAGIEADYFGNIVVDERFKTSVGHIYAVGDVVQSPMYESVRRDQGRMAAAIVFGLKDTEQLSEAYPVGVYALPEIAFFGMTEAQARALNIPIIIGRAAYDDIPYGRLCSTNDGMIKLVINKDTEEILGVHIIGRSSQEVIHFGMQLVSDKIRVTRVVGTIFNGGSLHELYHFAAQDALTKLH